MLMCDIDNLIITETKLDDLFPVSQFEIDGFSTPFRLDRNKNGGGILLYIRSYIVASKLNNYIFPNDIEVTHGLSAAHIILIEFLFQRI